MPRFFIDTPLATDQEALLTEVQLPHLRAFRLQVGDSLTLFNGQGGEYQGQLISLDKRQARVMVNRHDPIERESPLAITLIQALPSADKMDYIVQKAVELGVSRIIPTLSSRSIVRLPAERAEKKALHWRAIAAAACEQCGRNRIPAIEAIRPWGQWPLSPANLAQPRWILAPSALSSWRALQNQPAPDEVSLLVGPEGGFSPEEIADMAVQGWQSLLFGPRILRTETAGLAAMAALQARWGDF